MENDLFGCHGPNGIFGVRGIGGEVTEGLHVGLPLVGDRCVCGKSSSGNPIALRETFVAFGAEFLPRLGVDEFLQLRLELLFWGFFVAIGVFNFFIYM